MPDTSEAWEDLTLSLTVKEGINSTDATEFVVDPIPSTEKHLIAGKKALRVAIMLHCGDLAGLYEDREEFFDAIAALGATSSDPIYEDLQYALALFWWAKWYNSHLLSESDRMFEQMQLAMKEGERAAKALCKSLGIELDKATRVQGSTRTVAASSLIHAYGVRGIDY